MTTNNINAIFPLHIYESVIPSHTIENEVILETIKELVINTPLGWGYKWAELSNIWNSHAITEHILDMKEFSKIKSEIQKCFIEYLHQSDMLYDNKNITFNFSSSWINVHKQGQGQEYHTHIGVKQTKFSGVYYVDVTNKTGDIRFRHPYYTLLKTWASDSLYIECYKIITPTNGKILIFPSWLEHMVNKNLDTVDRISIAFNINVSLL